MELQVGVKVLLEQEGKYLLLRRSAEKYPEVGAKWEIAGGRIDPGSPLLDNLQREVKEETGLELVALPVLIAAQDILRVPGRHVVRLTYTGVIEGTPAVTEEHTEYRWFSLDEIKELEADELDSYFGELLTKGLFD